MFSRAADYSPDVALPIASVSGVLRHMGVSNAVAETPFSPAAWTSLQPSRGLVLWRDGEQPFTGRVTARELGWDADNGRAIIKVEAQDDRSRFAKRLSLPDPLRAADDQTVNDYWMSRTAGAPTSMPASTAMLQLISDQAGATCRADRQIPGLTLGPDPAVGVSRVWSALFTPVMDQLAIMSAASGANLGLRMTSATGSLTATVVQPRDLTDTVVFSADLSNLAGFTYRETEPDVTHALSAGQGDLHLRLRKLVTTTDPLALAWGEQSWSYIDRRDTADVAELQKADDDALADGGPTVSLAVKLTDSQAATYGVDWGLGDALTVYVGLPGQTKVTAVSDVCREIAFSVDEKGLERLTPAIGTVDAKAVLPGPTQQKLTEVASGLSNLIARK